MTLSLFATEAAHYLVVIPSALLCFLPMKNQLRYGISKIACMLAFFFSAFIPAMVLSSFYLHLSSGILIFLLIAIAFPLYHRSLRVHVSQSLAVFCLVCALMAFSANYTNGFDALIHPRETVNDFCLISGLIQFGIGLVLLLLLAYPLLRFGSWLIDHLHLANTWYMMVFVSILFLVLNLALVPYNYQTLYTNHVFRTFWITLSALLALMFLMCVIFYYIARGILTSAETSERLRFLQMQESQYLAQKKYMMETTRMRHDFRHSLYTLKGLSDAKDYKTLNSYLNNYAASMPDSDIIYYCDNNAVNALLNFYAHSARMHHIKLCWKIELSTTPPQMDNDLCSLLGNILENAQAGCLTLPEEQRCHHLSIQMRHDIYLYIVSTNSFDGNVRKKDGAYLSTHRNGSGLGLSSISVIAEKYNGSARFSHENQNFYIDVMLKP